MSGILLKSPFLMWNMKVSTNTRMPRRRVEVWQKGVVIAAFGLIVWVFIELY